MDSSWLSRISSAIFLYNNGKITMILYYPKMGEILICNYNGFKEPEMVKIRPVVVISPKHRSGSRLCTVVPLSTTTPIPQKDYHYLLKLERKLPKPFDSSTCWVKADMINTVSLDRLDLIRCGKIQGKRNYFRAKVTKDQLQEIQQSIKNALGIK
ncbi:MAG: type II toxin-antitoxin system PemK/MazF family toxin [Bacteroidales bacterium]|nr:type II toxin-antitoxin system PemK/MazF family toxin [Candidatus Scybalousia scybalohippi]